MHSPSRRNCCACLDFLTKERKELLHAQENSTTSAWRVCGFFPFHPNPDNWKEVLSTLGKQNKELEKGKEEVTEYNIVAQNVTADKVLTQDKNNFGQKNEKCQVSN